MQPSGWTAGMTVTCGVSVAWRLIERDSEGGWIAAKVERPDDRFFVTDDAFRDNGWRPATYEDLGRPPAEGERAVLVRDTPNLSAGTVLTHFDMEGGWWRFKGAPDGLFRRVHKKDFDALAPLSPVPEEREEPERKPKEWRCEPCNHVYFTAEAYETHCATMHAEPEPAPSRPAGECAECGGTGRVGSMEPGEPCYACFSPPVPAGECERVAAAREGWFLVEERLGEVLAHFEPADAVDELRCILECWTPADFEPCHARYAADPRSVDPCGWCAEQMDQNAKERAEEEETEALGARAIAQAPETRRRLARDAFLESRLGPIAGAVRLWAQRERERR